MFKEWHVLGESEKQKGFNDPCFEQTESHQSVPRRAAAINGCLGGSRSEGTA